MRKEQKQTTATPSDAREARHDREEYHKNPRSRDFQIGMAMVDAAVKPNAPTFLAAQIARAARML